MRLMDEIHLKRPYLGTGRIGNRLKDQSYPTNRKKVQTFNATCGDRSTLLKTFNPLSGSMGSNLSLPSQGLGHHPAESGLGNGY